MFISLREILYIRSEIRYFYLKDHEEKELQILIELSKITNCDTGFS